MTYLTRILAAMALWSGLAVAGSADETGDTGVWGAHGLRLPATFTGTLPCADCAGIDHHLDLFADQTYQMRRIWEGKPDPAVRDEVGRWYADGAKGAIVLFGASEGPSFWEVKAPDRIRAMDLSGMPIESDLPYDLTAGPLDETDLSLFVTGMLTYMADAAVFEECLTGRRYPVALDGAWIDAERAYLAAGTGGEPRLVTMEATIGQRPAMEGPPRRTVTVDRFVGIFPGQGCTHEQAQASLTDTYWRIETLMGQPVDIVDGRQEPHIVLRSGDGQSVNATVGCNMMRGTWTGTDGGLAFGPMAATMMACPEPLMTREHSLGEALAATAGWEVAGTTLILLDAEHNTLATLRAVYLK